MIKAASTCRGHGAWLWWVLCVAGSALLLGSLLSQLTFITRFSWKNLCFSALAESALVLLPYLYLPPRWRPLMWIPLLSLPLLLMVCLLHARAFGILPAIVSASLLKGLDAPTLGTALSLLRPGDMIFALVPAAEFAGYMVWRRQIVTCRITMSVRLSATAATLLVTGAAVWFKYNMYERRFRQYTPSESFATFIHNQDYRRGDLISAYSQLAWRGFADYLVHSGKDALITQPVNTPATDREIAAALARNSLSARLPDEVTAALPEPRNLIMVIIESWVTPGDTSAAGADPMPHLRALMAEPDAIVIDDVGIRATVGRSADGQFIYNTGLLPPRGETWVSRHAVADYPSLAKALPVAASLEIITEGESVWNHAYTSPSLGFDRLLSGIERSIRDQTQDSVLMDMALDEIARLPRPFYVQLTTGTMHEPYGQSDVPRRIDRRAVLAAGYTPSEYVYLERLHFTDRHIGRFIDSLRASGVADSSVIVIAADHHPTVMPPGRAFGPLRSPLIIIGSGMARLPRRSDFEQTDLFPTLLDIMGASEYRHPVLSRISHETDSIADAPYRGMGRSLFDLAARGDTTALRALGSKAVTGGTFRYR